jgi:hypothetical protein
MYMLIRLFLFSLFIAFSAQATSFKYINTYKSKIAPYAAKSANDKLYYFSEEERVGILNIAVDITREIAKQDRLGAKKGIAIRRNRMKQKYVKRLQAKVKKYSIASAYILETFKGGNALLTVFGEKNEDYLYTGKNYRKIVRELIEESQETENNDMFEGLSYIFYPTMMDLAKYKKELAQALKNNKIDKEIQESIYLDLNHFFDNMEEILELKKDLSWTNGRYTIFYHIKVAIAKIASSISLPMKHRIDNELLNEHDDKLNPGDIGLIQRYGKLSNIAFVGNWTHSLIYLGRYDKLEKFFNTNDINEFYTNKCESLKLDCHSLVSYLEQTQPEKMQEYKASQDSDDPIMTIEALRPGVILLTQKKSMGWDNLVTLRPKLDKIDIAKSIEKAFSLLGTKYDYNFDSYTSRKLVCTELISTAYAPDSRINKKGLDWEMNFVMKRPVMYAFDILETYFKREGRDNQQLEISLYLKSNKKKRQRARLGSIQELRKTVDITD